ncbi:MAG: lytic transglycosylase domain-containing protein [Gammaproteobacteria bacterium]|nr:lytic transglycosylase domain-containing protein [Gammaproteobacteria bacterium]
MRHRSRPLSALLAAAVLCGSGPAAAEAVDPLLKDRLKAAIADSTSFEDQYAATVWLTDMALRLEGRVADPDERVAILRHVHAEAVRAELHPELVLAVIDVESAFDRFAISVAGARGLMQVMPFWLRELDEPEANLFDIQTNLRMGCTILRYYLDMENGELAPALARYNGSTGKRWYPERVLGRLSSRWFQS